VEPVERAALRFCEALTQWRGKPELETVSPHLLSAFYSSLPIPKRISSSHVPLPLPLSLECAELSESSFSAGHM
jgi:hypothetical protein